MPEQYLFRLGQDRCATRRAICVNRPMQPHTVWNGGAARRGFVTALFALAWPTANAGAAEFNWNDFLGPFHNVVLHYPVGFITMACLLDVYCWRTPSEEMRGIIRFTLWLSFLSTVAAALLGFARASDGGYNEQTLGSHELYGVMTIVLCVAALVAARPALKPDASTAARWSYRFVLVTTFTVMGIAGHKGGDLTHGSGYLTKHAPAVLKEILGEHTTKKEREPKAAGTDSETGATNAMAGGETAKPSLFASVIWPALEAKCIKCHGEEKHKGDYRMDTREFALTAGESELKPIVPGKPDESFLVELIELSEDDDEVMPPSGKEQLTPEEKKAVRQWILDGAPWGSAVTSSK